jgi:hypothetical protein
MPEKALVLGSVSVPALFQRPAEAEKRQRLEEGWLEEEAKRSWKLPSLVMVAPEGTPGALERLREEAAVKPAVLE